uniref:Remorin C-terminal domain-containing protein n=1 Tax=Aegilops tauschii TaxID=37682 RepID=R7W8G3_AEGTA
MEYERIHKPQAGALSPTKLRMKLLGAHNRVRVISSSSSRTSPSKNAEPSLAHNRLLVCDVLDEVSDSSGASKCPAAVSNTEVIDKDSAVDGYKVQKTPKSSVHQPAPSNSSMIHPVRTVEEDSNECDSGLDNASTSSFEFHGGEKTAAQNPTAGYFSRQASSKWNDAEKWIVNKQTVQQNTTTKGASQNQSAHQIKVLAPSRTIRRVKLKPIQLQLSPAMILKAVSVRDVGTEMTPIPSQDPSRTGTPLGSVTPTRSPNCSIPSTPVGGRSSASIGEDNADDGPYFNRKGGMNEMSEDEIRLKARKEIAALGVQLGKMNIASWASKEELELVSATPSIADLERMKQEYATRAAAFEDAENSKHTARFKKEELKIEAWESRQRTKVESEMKRLEERAEKMRSEAMARMAERLELARRVAEEKRASANAKMNKQAARAVQKADLIRQTGRIPGSRILCCGCFCEP